MKAILLADIHIKLGQKNVPTNWQKNRFKLLAEAVNAHSPQLIFIAGDLLDVADPSIAEVGLLYDFLFALQKPNLEQIVLIPGNHEMENSRNSCYKHIITMLQNKNVLLIEETTTLYGIDFIPYGSIKSFKKSDKAADWAITHVRGEIPPHVTPEIDLSVFSEYDAVFAGDLHARSNSQLNILYPGSPMTTSFHRNKISGENGMFVMDVVNKTYNWVELELPQLLRKRVSSPEDMVKTEFHHTIYELEGDLDDLAKVGKSDLLDKKLTKDIGTPPTLELSGDITEELAMFLKEVKGISDTSEYIAEFKAVVHD